MTLEEAYAEAGGDLQAVRARLLTDERIEKFAKLFLQDDSMETLVRGLETGDLNEAFRAAHSLKGTSRELGFTALYEVACKMSDALRMGVGGAPANMAAVPELLPQMRAAYVRVVNAISAIGEGGG